MTRTAVLTNQRTSAMPGVVLPCSVSVTVPGGPSGPPGTGVLRSYLRPFPSQELEGLVERLAAVGRTDGDGAGCRGPQSGGHALLPELPAADSQSQRRRGGADQHGRRWGGGRCRLVQEGAARVFRRGFLGPPPPPPLQVTALVERAVHRDGSGVGDDLHRVGDRGAV